jgi:hypothetical protein
MVLGGHDGRPALRAEPIGDHRHGSDAAAEFLSFRLSVGGTK